MKINDFVSDILIFFVYIFMVRNHDKFKIYGIILK